MTDANELYSQGNALRSQNKYQEAIEAYDKALALNASFAEDLYDKGLALHNLNKFQEAIECYNKALEINPNIGAIWENKAICAFWRSVGFLNEDKIVSSNAREIRTFLSASKENDPNSETYNLTADAIGSNLATILQLKIAIKAPDQTTKVGGVEVKMFSVGQLNRIKDCLETMETAFEIMENKDISILKYLVNEYSNLGKVKWWEPIKSYGDDSPSNLKLSLNGESSGIDVQRKREGLIKKIQSIEPGYTPPAIKVTLMPKWVFYFGIAFIVLMVILSLAVK